MRKAWRQLTDLFDPDPVKGAALVITLALAILVLAVLLPGEPRL